MDNNHRKLISCNIDKLVRLTEYKFMIQRCFERDLLTQTMCDIIETDGKDDMQKNKLLFQKLVHRGPLAFHELLKILTELQYSEALKLLSQSTIPLATFSNEMVVIDDNALSISSTMSLNRNNTYSPPSPNNNSNPIIRDDEADSQMIMTALNDGPICSKPKKNKLEPYTEQTSFRFDQNLEIKRAANFGSHPKLPVYSMKSKRRGVFFFVNIINFESGKNNRTGAENDRENMVTLFREMNYTVFYYEDLKQNDFFELIGELKNSEYLKGVDSFVLCVQTHGDIRFNQTLMEFSDGKTASTEFVIEQFSNVSCKTLIKKPKVFFFPFCRGSISDLEKKFNLAETDGVPTPTVPSFSDILICYGTVPGFMTHRDTHFGSWYVRELCKIFAEHAADSHIEDMLKMVASKTMELRDAGRLQVASTENRGFIKLMFFNPKISD